MKIPNHYLEKIRAVYPNLSLDRLELNQDGMNNDVVIINHQIVCRFPKTDETKEDLKNEVKVLQIIQPFIDLPIPYLEHVEGDFVSYPFIPGEALSRHRLFKLDSLI
jgi:aminoglycoside 2''-phosphotransferase